MDMQTELEVNKKCKGAFCEWRRALESQIKFDGAIVRKPVHCEGCALWVE